MSSAQASNPSSNPSVERRAAENSELGDEVHPFFKAVRLLFRAAFLLATFATIIWALIRHGERSKSTLDAACQNRLKDTLVGFDGDSDFYGFGIRLGIYLQWLTVLITTGYLEEDRQYVFMTYQIFSISITVALLVKIFTSACTFSVEIFTVLVLFWGGYNIVQTPMMQAMSWNKFEPRLLDLCHLRLPASSRKLKWITQLLTFVMSPVTIWFWARTAAAEGVDFASTPGGTAYFFFARIHGHALKPFDIFMATASTINFIYSVYVRLPTPSWMWDHYGRSELSTNLIMIVWLPLFMIFCLPELITTIFKCILILPSIYLIKGLNWLLRSIQSLVGVNRQTGISRLSTLERGEPRESSRDSADEAHSELFLRQVYLFITERLNIH